MISRGPAFEKQKKPASSRNAVIDRDKAESIKKQQQAAAELFKEFIEAKRKKAKPKVLWLASGCLLVVILAILASFLIPLFTMVKDAKDTVREHLKLIQNEDFDAAYKMCDSEFIDRKTFDRIAQEFHELLTNGSYKVEKFSTIEKQATVRGKITYSDGKEKYITYNLYYNPDEEAWKVIKFRFGLPVQKPEKN